MTSKQDLLKKIREEEKLKSSDTEELDEVFYRIKNINKYYSK